MHRNLRGRGNLLPNVLVQLQVHLKIARVRPAPKVLSPAAYVRSLGAQRLHITATERESAILGMSYAELRLPLFGSSLVNRVKSHATCWLTDAIPGVIVGLVLASGCDPARTSGSRNPAASPS